MTKDEFLNAASELRVREDAYNLEGEGDECYVLSRRGISWDVYYSERGLQTGTRTFSSMSAALEHLLEMLAGDPSTAMNPDG